MRLNPVQFLVANKGDMNPTSETYQQIMQAAACYSEENMIKLMEVCALIDLLVERCMAFMQRCRGRSKKHSLNARRCMAFIEN